MHMNEELSASIQAICSVINLAIVILFFIFERISSIRFNKTQQRAYWYHETVLKNGMPAIDHLFNNLESIFANLQTCVDQKQILEEKTSKQAIADIQNFISDIKRFMSPYLKLFDKKLNHHVASSFRDLEDITTNCIEKMYQDNQFDNDIYKKLSDYKYQLLAELYNYDLGKTKMT